MVRQTRSSQRAPHASQSQPPRATQGARARRTQMEEEPEEDHHAQDVPDDDEVGERGDGVSRPIFYLRTLPKHSHLLQEIDKKARDLVRLALFHEQRRLPLRRDEISKKGTPSMLHACCTYLNVKRIFHSLWLGHAHIQCCPCFCESNPSQHFRHGTC